MIIEFTYIMGLEMPRFAQAALLSAVLFGCNGDVSKWKPTEAPSATEVQLELMRQHNLKIPDMAVPYFPKLEEEASLRSKDRIPTKGTAVEVYNYSDYDLNVGVAEEIYRQFDILLEDPIINKTEPNALGESYKISFSKNNGRKSVMLLPKGATLPIGAKGRMGIRKSKDGESLSYLMVGKYDDIDLFPNEKTDTTLSFVLQACASMTDVEAKSSNGTPLTAEQFSPQTALERFCFTLGLGIAARTIDVPYETYSDTIKSRNTPQLRIDPISRGMYNSIGQGGPVIDKKVY